jgi:host factor-I protein
MPPKTTQRLQDTFLTYLVTHKVPVTVFLLNGVKLQGEITTYDDFCVSLGRDGQVQALYKQEISTISTDYPISLWEDPEAPKRPGRPAGRPVRGRPLGGKPLVEKPLGGKLIPGKVVVERKRRIIRKDIDTTAR